MKNTTNYINPRYIRGIEITEINETDFEMCFLGKYDNGQIILGRRFFQTQSEAESFAEKLGFILKSVK
jgi:hypothetical protein